MWPPRFSGFLVTHISHYHDTLKRKKQTIRVSNQKRFINNCHSSPTSIWHKNNFENFQEIAIINFSMGAFFFLFYIVLH